MIAEFWPTFWAAVLAISLGGYALLVLVVTIGGLGDIRAMFRALGGAASSDEKRE